MLLMPDLLDRGHMTQCCKVEEGWENNIGDTVAMSPYVSAKTEVLTDSGEVHSRPI